MYPKPYSIYLRGTIGLKGLGFGLGIRVSGWRFRVGGFRIRIKD